MPKSIDIPKRRKVPIFSYNPILNPMKETRLVIIEPAKNESSEIKLSLQPAVIATAQYEALSYSWGNPTATLPITVNGFSFDVTTNLFHALHNLRKSDEKRTIWIDAICIDQKNADERGKQVSNMMEIYKAATKVVVWLGRDFEPEDLQISFSESIWGFDELEHGTRQSTEFAFDLMNNVFEERDVSDVPVLHWGYLSRLLRRSWFRRLWVVQEVQMSRHTTIVCGKSEISWKVLEGAVMQFRATHPTINDAKMPFLFQLGDNNVGGVGLWDVDRNNILTLLIGIAQKLATDPRDRLFAIVGLLDVPDPDIRVDYTQPTEVVYREWVWNRINRTKNLDVLVLCQDSSTSGARDRGGGGMDLPSWVPDLRHLRDAETPLTDMSMNGTQDSSHKYTIPYNACGTMSSGKLERNSDPNVLAIPSIKIDKIVKKISYRVKATWDRVMTDNQLVEQLIHWEQEVEEHFGVKMEDDAELLSSFLDTFFSGIPQNTEIGSPYSEIQRYHHFHQDCFIPQEYMPDSPASIRKSQYFRLILTSLNQFCYGIDLFITEKGYLGHAKGACHIQVDDEVHVLFGGGTPYILYKSDKKDEVDDGRNACDWFRLQGPCYLSGFMDGQAVELVRKGVVQPEGIYIW